MGNKGGATLHSFLYRGNKHQSLGLGHGENDRREEEEVSKCNFSESTSTQ